jgi:hypothetical protein
MGLPLCLLAIPLTTIHDMERGWPRNLAMAVGALFTAAAICIAGTGLLIGVAEGPHGGGAHSPLWETASRLARVAVAIYLPFCLCILAWSFVSPHLSRVQPQR